jgi:hypothetical protein
MQRKQLTNRHPFIYAKEVTVGEIYEDCTYYPSRFFRVEKIFKNCVTSVQVDVESLKTSDYEI